MSQSQDTSNQSKDAYKGFGAKIFAFEGMIFLAVQALGLWAGWSLLNQGYASYGATSESIFTFLLAFIFATFVIIVLLKFLKSPVFFKGLMAFLIFVGAQTVFAVLFSELAAVFIAIALLAAHFYFINVFTQNLAMGIAIAGVGASLGLVLPVPAIIVILLILSLYDYIAVYHTKHMVAMFKGLLDKGVPMSLVIPDKASRITDSVGTVAPGTGKYLLLGTGDVAFPIIFAVSALNYSFLHAIGVIIGAFFGLIVVHWILIKRAKGAVPALPPISILSIIGFMLVHFLVGV